MHLSSATLLWGLVVGSLGLFWPIHGVAAELAASAYRLGPSDSLKVSIFGRPDLSGSYRVRSSGEVSLPLIGDVLAANRTLDELESDIARLYSETMAGVDGPRAQFNANIEIISYRPFFILGDVSRPGHYEFEPGLTVLKAIAMAGGYASSGPDSRLSETRAREEFNVLSSRYIAGVAREARLIAEREGLSAIPFPSSLIARKDEAFVQAILAIEEQLFDLRRSLLEQELEIIDKREQQYVEEDEALAAQAAAVESKRAEVESLLKGAETLANKGVLPKTELSNLVIMQADVERESREIIVDRSRAKQGINETQQEALILRGQRLQQVAAELEAAQVELDEILVRLNAEAERLAVLEIQPVSSQDTSAQDLRPAIEITRDTPDGSRTIQATESTIIQPDDVISVPHRHGALFLSVPERTSVSISSTPGRAKEE